MIHAYRRDYEAALEQFAPGSSPGPSRRARNEGSARSYGRIRKDLDEAVAAFQRAIDLSPHSPRMHGALARTLALSGKKSLALASLRKLESIARQRYVSPFDFATVRFALDQLELGFKWLGKACDDRAFDVLALKVDPRVDPYKHSPRFHAILKDVGLS